jgi:leader peptidase (prepilin peptidase)/N-methyltransferase
MDLQLIFNILASLVFGTLIGSFLNVVIWRLPRELGLGGRSHCPNCHKKLAPFELLPLLSYISSRGRCRQCHRPISIRYPAIEAMTGLLFVVAWMHFQPGFIHPVEWIVFIKSLVVISACIVIFVIDFEHFLILDKVLLTVGIMVLALNLGLDLLMGHSLGSSLVLSGLIGALAAGAVFLLIWFLSGGKWMGLGDVKLVVLLGLTFGYAEVGILLLLAFWLGLAVSLVLLAARKAGMNTKLPFGTFLTVAAVIMLFFGQPLLHWYLRLIGLPSA